jgi:SNF2 family DNA or RNA helicase
VNDRGKIKISPLQAAVGDDIFNGDSAIQVDEAWVKLRNKIIDSYGLKPRVPSTLKADLRDYQLEGYKWMKRLTDWGGGACLADDMGLGKTVQAIAYLLSEAKKGAALVVAPASVLPNWRNELERFAPTLNVKILNSSTDRAGDVSTAGPGDVVVTTYGLLVSEENMLVDKKWHTVCLDEAHAIKNRDTKMSKVAMQLDAKNRIAMTGTPIQNHLGELWNLFQFLNPGLLGTHEQFHKKFIVPIENEDNHGMQRHLKKIIAPFMLRRTKSEVVDELPDKTEIKISVDLTDEETAVYETIRVRAEQQLQEQNRVDVNVLAQITQLRRAACTPKLVNDSFKGESSKLDAFVSLVDEIASGGNKVLVFSQFTSFLQLAKEQLDKAGIKYLYFDGSTTIAKREKIIEQFRSGEVQLFLISLKAGGLGLNLTEANYVIHLDPWWNPAIEQQATDRAYRIGQKQKVTVYHLISAHTIEEKILRLHAVKRDLADQLLEGTNISHKLTAKDLLEMLSTAE